MDIVHMIGSLFKQYILFIRFYKVSVKYITQYWSLSLVTAIYCYVFEAILSFHSVLAGYHLAVGYTINICIMGTHYS